MMTANIRYNTGDEMGNAQLKSRMKNLLMFLPNMVVREHWRGGGDIVRLAESAATIAPLLMPKRVARVLLAKVTPTAEGTGLLAKGAKFEPVLVETGEEKHQSDRVRRLANFAEKKKSRRSRSA